MKRRYSEPHKDTGKDTFFHNVIREIFYDAFDRRLYNNPLLDIFYEGIRGMGYFERWKMISKFLLDNRLLYEEIRDICIHKWMEHGIEDYDKTKGLSWIERQQKK
jgi:hypothetical protein